tara:strand:+ start:498 stop:779 length:282 start_codon:yes stop_codon:yes gene_type:complete
MNKKKLRIARNKIDRLDKSIFNLIKKRTKIVKYILSLKHLKKQIVDQKRINIILKDIRKKSIRHSLDPNITNRIWKAMIGGYIDFEKRNFKRK